jgi:hypothetical protein
VKKEVPMKMVILIRIEEKIGALRLWRNVKVKTVYTSQCDYLCSTSSLEIRSTVIKPHGIIGC